MKKKFVLIIPARYHSSRLPGKPLIKILGIPMLIRTYNQCKKVVSKEKIIVATDDLRIIKICKSNNINCIMTKKSCLTGTDRISELSKKLSTNQKHINNHHIPSNFSLFTFTRNFTK